MKKNAFTLVELLSVIAILGIIAMLVFPNLSSTNDEKKKQQYNAVVETIENAGKSYMYVNKVSKVYLTELIKDDFLASNPKNPVTGEVMSGCVYKTVVSGVNTYKYESSTSVCSTK